jgi:diguanylate cyclase
VIIQSSVVYLVLPCTLLVFAIGYYLGAVRVKDERQDIMKTLSTILQSADELSHNVGSHNSELSVIEQTVEGIEVATELGETELGDMHQRLLGHISSVISANKKLEDDLVCSRYTLDQQARELDRTREEARTDELSQLGNRKAFDESLNYRLSKWKRHGNCFALILIDVDRFKWINDTHGHQAGDRVVSGVGQLLRDNLTPDDFLARYGGDEFALLIESKDREATLDTAERIRAAAESQNFSATGHGERVAITFSMGLAIVRKGDTVESLFSRADTALYESKSAGRNCVRSEAAPGNTGHAEAVLAS